MKIQNSKRMKIEMGNCFCKQRVEPNSPVVAPGPDNTNPKLISLDGASQRTTRSCNDSPRRTSTRSSQTSLSLPDKTLQQQQQNHHQTKSTTFADTYHLLNDEMLGFGIAGIVHKCIHRPSSRVCAVKVITKSKIRSMARIQREIAILQRVKQQQHSNIIQLLDVYEDDTTVHIVTELCQGGELYDKIVRLAKSRRNSNIGLGGSKRLAHCFRERDAAHIIHELLSAVSYLHSVDIVHRDLKPENIVLFNDVKEMGDSIFCSSSSSSSSSSQVTPYTIKLIDFGLSTRHTPQDAPLTSIVGTSYYMSPEILAGSYDRSCDLWSIGVITYAILTGRPPFNGTDNNEILSKIRNCQVQMNKREGFWDGVPNGKAKDFIQCLMTKDPKKRYTADMALEHPWLKEVARLKE